MMHASKMNDNKSPWLSRYSGWVNLPTDSFYNTLPYPKCSTVSVKHDKFAIFE